jgi:hypothetical protein
MANITQLESLRATAAIYSQAVYVINVLHIAKQLEKQEEAWY